MQTIKYKRILVKLSGEALLGAQSSGIDPQMIDKIAAELIELHDAGVQVACVVGGGNLLRGASLAGKGVDRVIDVEAGININDSAAMLKVNGVIASYSSSKNPEPVMPFYPLMFKNISLHLVLVYNMPESAKTSAINDIHEALEAGQLKHRIARHFTLAQTPNAHRLIEQGGVEGCVIIQMRNAD